MQQYCQEIVGAINPQRFVSQEEEEHLSFFPMGLAFSATFIGQGLDKVELLLNLLNDQERKIKPNSFNFQLEEEIVKCTWLST